MTCTIVFCVDVMKCGGWCRSALLCHVIFSHDRIGRESPACCVYSIYVGCSTGSCRVGGERGGKDVAPFSCAH